ncbi:hypothetical protein BaRGS_00021182, partial [Batillaria attramentaria]
FANGEWCVCDDDDVAIDCRWRKCPGDGRRSEVAEVIGGRFLHAQADVVPIQPWRIYQSRVTGHALRRLWQRGTSVSRFQTSPPPSSEMGVCVRLELHAYYGIT